MGEDHGTHPVVLQDSPAFGKRGLHGFFKEDFVLSTTIRRVLHFVLYNLGALGRK